MVESRQRHAERLFKEILAVPIASRDSELAARCDGDAELADEVRGLLAFAADDDGPLDASAPSRIGIELEAPRLLPEGKTIGRYRLLRVLGEGGMGVVYVAEQERPKRTVALKVIRPGFASPAMLRRFEYEAEILGKLQHPGIAQVIEAGIAELYGGCPGQPFLAMELIEGIHIGSFVREQNLSIRDRVALFIRVCEAVEHAHQRGVIHRDLKPGNILVDRTGQPKILDFGVARAATPDSDDARLTIVRTGIQQLIGTLAYMSPEQVSGSQSGLDTRSDVYSLGVVLFELITERLPLDLSERSVPDAARMICDAAPTDPGRFVHECRGDLETIILKALEKDRAHRYQAAADLAADLRRFLIDAPITARPPSAMYHIRKFAKRNKKFVAAFGVAAAALVIGFAGTVYGLITARHERDDAVHARRVAEDATDFMLDEMIANAAPTTPDFKNIRLSTVVRQAAKSAPDRFAADPATRLRVLTGLGCVLYELGEYGEALPCFRGALAAAEQAFGPDSGMRVRPLLRLAAGLDALGLHAESNERRAQAVALAVKSLPHSDRDALDARGSVLFMSVAFGNRDAEKELRDMLAEYDSAGQSTGDTYNSLSEELAKNLITKGRHEEGLAIHRALIDRCRKIKGPLHADTLAYSVPFIEMLDRCGLSEEALELGLRTLAEMEHVYDVGHLRLLSCRKYVAEVLLTLDRVDESLTVMCECMQYVPMAYLKSPLDRANYEIMLARALCDSGSPEEAILHAERAMIVHREYFGDSHYSTLDSLCIFGRCVALLPGCADAGLTMMRNSIDRLSEQKRGSSVSQRYLADTLYRLSRFAEARDIQTRVTEDSARIIGDDNPYTKRMRERLEKYARAAEESP